MTHVMDSAIARQFERLPPHSVEAEMCLLASMMLDVSKDAVGQIVQIVDEESFFQADHAILFKALKKLYESNRPIDAMIVREEYSPHETAEIVLENAEKKIFQIAEKKVAGQMTPMEDVLHEVFEMIENRGQRGIETGFFELDDMLNGLQRGEMIIVAARPSMGKTAMAMNVIEHVAANSLLPCAVF